MSMSDADKLAEAAKQLNINAVEFVPSFAMDEEEPAAPAAVEPVAAKVEAPREEAAKSGKTKSKSSLAESAEPESEEAKEFYQDSTASIADGDDKETLNVVFIGHVDAGKSTLGGHILYLTGMVDQRTLEKYEREAKEMNRESWFYSWALDTNDEERSKGKTVFCGKAYFETPKRRVVIIDAPGHRAYVPNMISGLAQADVGILVISARKGEFEAGFERGGQTCEHAMVIIIWMGFYTLYPLCSTTAHRLTTE